MLGSPQRSTMIDKKKFTETDEGPIGSIDGSQQYFNENIRSQASQLETPGGFDHISFKSQQNLLSEYQKFSDYKLKKKKVFGGVHMLKSEGRETTASYLENRN